MKPFRRIFKYVWPQWPLLVAIVVTAMVIAVLFSLSFMTVMPLLKVMMGEEGLHGWVDRKTCDVRYGMDFYVPATTDYTNINTRDIAYYLLINEIEKNALAETAGLRRGDQIVGAGKALVGEQVKNAPSAKLLEELATAAVNTEVIVQFKRLNAKGELSQTKSLKLSTAEKNTFAHRLKNQAMNNAQQAISFIPRGQAGAYREKAVIFIIIVMAIVTTVRCIAKFFQIYLGEKVVQVAIAQLRRDSFSHVMDMPIGFFSTEGTSDTTSRILGDTAVTGKGVKVLLGKALREPLKAIATLSFAMAINYKLTLIFLAIAPVTIGLLGILGKRIKKATKKSLISSALMLGKLEGVMKALRVVKVYNRQSHERIVYQGLNRRFLRQVLRIAKVQASTSQIMEFLGMVASSAALVVGAHWVFDININMQPSAFFTLLVLLGATAESVRKLSDVWNKIQQANAAATRVFSIIDQPPEFEKPDAIELQPMKELLEFQDIVFTYPGADVPALNRINLKVTAGQTVAIVGPNGSGKTTLVNLIPRFYDIDSGAILIDGQNIYDGTLKSLRDQIGMVTQNVVTFNGSIAANIGYGKTDATMEEIIAAAKRSFAHEFIEPLPNGYDAQIGEHGTGFSGGQFQRIIIARAILKDPQILIFDEAMSQVDADSEAKIHEALSGLMRNRTCFVIAHRFSTVMSADMIVVFDGGQILDQGRHEDLVQRCSLYQNLYETQILVPE